MVFIHSFGSHEELVNAYRAWASLPPEHFKERDIAWKRYVAIRDGCMVEPVPEKKDSGAETSRRRLVQ